MGIYIKGIEMPKGNDSIALFIYPDGVVVMFEMFGPLGRYTAVPVPPHGRLVDADAFAEKNKYFWNCEFINPKYSETLSDLVEVAPTVIPASEEA